MKSSVNISIIVYFNGSIIRTTEEGVTFVYDKPICFRIPQIMSFAELKVGLCQDINVGT